MLPFQRKWYLEDFRPEECDSDKYDLEMVAILAAIFNMVAKTQQILKCSNAPITKIDI